MVVALDELGHLTCCYLGTDPSIFSSSSTASRELNYEVCRRVSYEYIILLWRDKTTSSCALVHLVQCSITLSICGAVYII